MLCLITAHIACVIPEVIDSALTSIPKSICKGTGFRLGGGGCCKFGRNVALDGDETGSVLEDKRRGGGGWAQYSLGTMKSIVP
jgi:hypothetical protein